ncbi:sterol desaturase [Shewanella sp. NFH-SH190041]|uniref:sterol desaturase family protein n=1 Tax=Shewanella sp. NFH-SH190041 TaxID=2950245 RepID=UPI0022061F52|nr:sterol desaturase [Shewanella sp. NFH-SH190041]
MLDWLIAHPEWLLVLLAPLFGILMVAEWFWGTVKQHLPQNGHYRLPELACNLTLAGLHQLMDLLVGLLVFKVYLWLFGWRLFDINMTPMMFFVLMLAQDFCYYWFHRASHRLRWFWAAHSVHHSSKNMNFSTALRQSMLYPLTGMWLFWLPLVIIGFPPQYVVLTVLVNLALQFIIHTQWIRSFGCLDRLLNSPSHHRVHHGRNPQYIDRNYAGLLIIWDKLFGTFTPETEPVEYGITTPVQSMNPVTVTFAEWRELWRDISTPGLTLTRRLALLWSAPKNGGLTQQDLTRQSDLDKAAIPQDSGLDKE